MAVLTNRPDASFGDDDWQALEAAIDRELTSDDRAILSSIFLECAVSQYAANNVPLLTEVRSKLEELHQQTSALRGLFLFENSTPDMRLALGNLLIQAYWRHPFECAAAHFRADKFSEYGSPNKTLSPTRGEIPHRVIHSEHSVAEFFRSITEAAKEAVEEVERRINDPLHFGFDKVEPQKKLIHRVRAWAKDRGIPYSKHVDDTLPPLALLIRQALTRLPRECQPDKIYTEKTIARELQRSGSPEK